MNKAKINEAEIQLLCDKNLIFPLTELFINISSYREAT